MKRSSPRTHQKDESLVFDGQKVERMSEGLESCAHLSGGCASLAPTCGQEKEEKETTTTGLLSCPSRHTHSNHQQSSPDDDDDDEDEESQQVKHRSDTHLVSCFSLLFHKRLLFAVSLPFLAVSLFSPHLMLMLDLLSRHPLSEKLILERIPLFPDA